MMRVRAAITQNGSGGLEWVFGGGRTISLTVSDLHILKPAFVRGENRWIHCACAGGIGVERISVKAVKGGQYGRAYNSSTGTYAPAPAPDPTAACVVHDDNGWEECLDAATVSALVSGIDAILAGGQAPAFIAAVPPIPPPAPSTPAAAPAEPAGGAPKCRWCGDTGEITINFKTKPCVDCPPG